MHGCPEAGLCVLFDVRPKVWRGGGGEEREDPALPYFFFGNGSGGGANAGPPPAVGVPSNPEGDPVA